MHRIAFCSIVLLLGCTQVTDPGSNETLATQVGEEFTLKVGNSAMVHLPPGQPVDLWVRFVTVAGDSRCPAVWRCVWQGDGEVVIQTALIEGGVKDGLQSDTLHTATSGGPGAGPDTVQLGAFQLKLVRLEPYPQLPESIRPDDYTATFLLGFAEGGY